MPTRKPFWQTWPWLLALGLIVLMSAACTGPVSNTETALGYADALQAAIEAFEQARAATSTRIDETSRKVSAAAVRVGAAQASGSGAPSESSGATAARAELSGLAEIWASEWQAVHVEFDQLEETFSVVGRRSQDYFLELDAITEQIRDPAIRAAEAEKNRQLKETWTAAYVQASEDLGTLRALVQVGDDFEFVLILEQMRVTLHEDIQRLEAVSSQAQALLVELEQLTVRGRQLTGGQLQFEPPRPSDPEDYQQQGT